jgi:SAM-dependent methyltransferase
MKTAAEIREILVDGLGFVDLAAYKQWIEEQRPATRPSTERIERLSPDAIDNRAFWRVCEELFGPDPVCNLAVEPAVGALPYAVEDAMDANRMNLRLARSLGLTAFLEENARARVKTLEIGPGYGSLKNYIEVQTEHRYTGVDVYPRVPGVLEATVDGLLPRELVEQESGSFSYVVSTNVFQHLSARQRTAYIQDAARLLHPGGLFIFTVVVDTSKVPAFMRDDEGRAWIDHYGQYTPMPKGGEIYDQVGRSFGILYVVQRYDGLFAFVCRRSQ